MIWGANERRRSQTVSGRGCTNWDWDGRKQNFMLIYNSADIEKQVPGGHLFLCVQNGLLVWMVFTSGYRSTHEHKQESKRCSEWQLMAYWTSDLQSFQQGFQQLCETLDNRTSLLWPYFSSPDLEHSGIHFTAVFLTEKQLNLLCFNFLFRKQQMTRKRGVINVQLISKSSTTSHLKCNNAHDSSCRYK